MLAKERLKQLQDFMNGYSREELIWINGYLAGLVGNAEKMVVADGNVGTPPTAVRKISLVYGTETGNAKRLATQLATIARQQGVIARLQGLDQYRVNELEKEEYFFVVISTQGEGEPPIPAKKFYEYLHQQKLQLKGMKFSILGLGDTAYPQFCKTAEDVDAQLIQAGARRVIPLRKCDVDYEEDAKAWFADVLKWLQQQGSEAVAAPSATAAVPAPARKPAGKKYYQGRILANINLNDRGSNKQTFHIELGTDEPIEYEPGDTIGILPRNRQEVVKRILDLTGADGTQVLTTAKASAPLAELLTEHLSICYLLSSTIKKYAAITGQDIPDTRMDLVDLLRIYPVKDAAQFAEVAGILLPIAPRLYSIASSPEAHSNQEVHITVAKDQFLAEEEQRFGLCSEFLGDLPIDSPLTFYVHKDKHFKLPAADKDVIMIGPGTGVAPFRAFLAHREATGATGRNWFFFGEQHFVTDFLYQVEMQNYLQTGVLSRIDLAFSRDQEHKIYVQHRMVQQEVDLFEWINKGASVYISGTKDPMSKEVEQTLIDIIARQGGREPAAAAQYLEQMRKEGRFAKDVY